MYMRVSRLCSPGHWPRYRYSPYLVSGTIRLAFRSAGRNCSRLRGRWWFRTEITSRCVTPQILWRTPFVPGIRSSGPPREFMEANNDLTGRCALVTGGTDGIGKEIARGLTARGARVLIVGSDPQKGKRVQNELREETGHDDVDFLRADLSLVTEVDRLAEEIATRFTSLHYLVLCAGIVRGRFTLTPEGIETNFAIGYLSRFVLVERLLAIMRQSRTAGSAAARIVVVSGAARNGTIHYDDVNLTHNFATLRVVSQLCEVVGQIHIRSEEHTSELQSLRHLVCRLLLEKKKFTK